MSSNGTLIPAASENSAVPPSQQGLTINAETPPIAQTPAMRPAGRRCEARVMCSVKRCGSRSS